MIFGPPYWWGFLHGLGWRIRYLLQICIDYVRVYPNSLWIYHFLSAIISKRIYPQTWEFHHWIKLRDSIGHCVGRSVSLSHLCFLAFLAFCKRCLHHCPAKSHATDTVMYTALLTAPARQITAPAQPLWHMLVCVLGFVHIKFFESIQALRRYALRKLIVFQHFLNNYLFSDGKEFKLVHHKTFQKTHLIPTSGY